MSVPVAEWSTSKELNESEHPTMNLLSVYLTLGSVNLTQDQYAVVKDLFSECWKIGYHMCLSDNGKPNGLFTKEGLAAFGDKP